MTLLPVADLGVRFSRSRNEGFPVAVSWSFGALVLTLGLAQTVAQTPVSPPSRPDEAKPAKPPADTIQQLPLPSNAVIVIPPDAKQALQWMQPGGIILSPEQYKAILERARMLEERIAELEQKAAPRKDAVMSQCALIGDVAGDVLTLRVELTFRTTSENQLVSIGLRGLRLLSAKLDGETPAWGPDLERPAIMAREPRVYQLVVELQTRVSRSGEERSVSLDLPPAAVTRLELNFTERIGNVSIRGRGDPVPIEHPEPQRSRIAVNLPVQAQLELSWRAGSGEAQSPTSQVTASGDIRVTLDDKTANTEALFLIECRQGALAMLPFQLADRALAVTVLDVEEMRDGARANEPRAERIAWRYEPVGQLLSVMFDPPLTSRERPLALRIRTRQQTAAAGLRTPLGHFALRTPARQTTQKGTITVSSAPGLLVRFEGEDLSVIDARDLPQRPAAREGEAVAAYRYWRQPARLEARIEPLRPAVDAKMAHHWHVSEAVLQLRCDLSFEIARAGIQELEIEWPRAVSFDRVAPQALIERVEPDPAAGVLRVRFIRRHQGSLKLHLEGSVLAGQAGVAAINVPTPLRARRTPDEKEAVSVVMPGGDELRLTMTEDLEVKLESGTTGLLGSGGRPIDFGATWREPAVFALAVLSGRTPHVALRWQPRRFDVRSDADVWITRRALKVRQTLTWSFGSSAPGRLSLRVPRTVDAVLRTRDKGLSDRRRTLDEETVERSLLLSRGLSGDYRLVLEWQLPIAENAEEAPVSIALVQPVEGVTVRGAARIWAPSNLRVEQAADGGWVRQTPEGAPEPRPLPNLVLCRSGPDTPLRIQRHFDATTQTPVVVDRMLVESRVADRQFGRACFRIPVVRCDEIVLAFPERLAFLDIERVILHPLPPVGGWPDGGALKPHEPVVSLEEETSRENKQRVHVPIEPFLLAGGLILEVRYQAAAAGRVGTRLVAPEIQGHRTVGQVRWCIDLPAGHVPLWNTGPLLAEQPWFGAGWLQAPQPVMRRDMKEWMGVSAAAPNDERLVWTYAGFADAGAFDVFHASQRGWTVVCSLLVVLGGLAVYLFGGRPVVFGGAAAAGLALVGMALPPLMRAILHGAQPGLLVLAGVLLVLWIRRQRWRRQVVLLPGFKRLKVGSSLVRAQAERRPAETSTVDAPVPSASSSELRA